MNRMKVLSILLLALVTVMLAVSCSESVEPPKAVAEQMKAVLDENQPNYIHGYM